MRADIIERDPHPVAPRARTAGEADRHVVGLRHAVGQVGAAIGLRKHLPDGAAGGLRAG
jgi:hypothetical protein